MNMLKASIAMVALLGFGAAASAKSLPGGGGPLPSIRSQITAEAKADGMLNGLTKPSIRVTVAKNGKSATASIWSMSKFSGPPVLNSVATRQEQATAKFKIGSVMEGAVVMPVKQYGQVWQHLLRAL